MTKVIKAFMVSAIIFALISASPAMAVDIVVESADLAPGGQVGVPIYLNNNTIDIMALSVPLFYSSASLSVDSVSFAGSLLLPGMSAVVNIDNPSKRVSIMYTPVSGQPLITAADGLIATVYMSADVGAPDQVVIINAVNAADVSELPPIYTRVEIADNSGSAVTVPGFYPANVEIQTPLDAGDDGSGLPYALEMKQNYPNPFNPTTTIAFTLPVRSDVSLVVYNILGQGVETLVDETLEAGEHQVVWDSNHNPSGIYFYRLTYKNEVLTKKMTLLK